MVFHNPGSKLGKRVPNLGFEKYVTCSVSWNFIGHVYTHKIVNGDFTDDRL